MTVVDAVEIYLTWQDAGHELRSSAATLITLSGDAIWQTLSCRQVRRVMIELGWVVALRTCSARVGRGVWITSAITGRKDSAPEPSRSLTYRWCDTLFCDNSWKQRQIWWCLGRKWGALHLRDLGTWNLRKRARECNRFRKSISV